jgi:hypothetical protein
MKKLEDDKNPLIEFLEFTSNCVAEKNSIPFIILTHLQIEQVLRERLYKRLELNIKNVNKKSLEESTTGYNRLIGLCHAIGIIKDNYKPAFIKLNQIRNKLAHTLGYKISEKDRDELIKSTPTIHQGYCENIFKEYNYTEKEKKFRKCIIKLYFEISYPLYHKIKIPSPLLVGKGEEVEIDDMKYSAN